MDERTWPRARFARQILLIGVGEEGQRRIERSVARVPSRGLAGEVAGAYASRAGFRGVVDGPGETAPAFVRAPAARDVIGGSLAVLREILAAIDTDDSTRE